MRTQLHEAFEKAAPLPGFDPDYEAMWRRGRRRRRIRSGLAVGATTCIAMAALVSVQTGVFSDILTGRRVGPASGPGAPARGTLFVAAIDREAATPIVSFIEAGSGDLGSTPISDFAPGDARTSLAVSGDSLVYTGADGVYSMPTDLRRGPAKIGSAAYFSPALVDGHVWLAVREAASGEKETLDALRQVVADDGSLVTEVALPPGRWTSFIGEVSSGLVFEDDGAITVWDASVARESLKIDDAFALALQGDLIAWCDTGDCGSAITIVSAAAGEETTVHPPADYVFTGEAGSALSPDGRYLATTVRGQGDERAFALVDVGTGTSEVIPALGGGGPVAWSKSSTEVFVVDDGQLLAYDPATDEVQLIASDLPPDVFALAGSTP